MNSLATKANQLLQKRYAGEMSTYSKIVDGKVVGSKSTAVGFLLTDSVRNIGNFLGEQAARSLPPSKGPPARRLNPRCGKWPKPTCRIVSLGLRRMAAFDLALTAVNGDRAAGASFRSSDDAQSGNQERRATLSDIESGKFNKELAGNADFVAAAKAIGITDIASQLLKDAFNPIDLMMQSWSRADRQAYEVTDPRSATDGQLRMAVLDLDKLDAQSKANLLSLTKNELKAFFESYNPKEIVGQIKLGLLGSDKVLIFEIKGSAIRDPKTRDFIRDAKLGEATVRVIHDFDSGKIFLDLTKQFGDGKIKDAKGAEQFMGFLKAAYGEKSELFESLKANLKALGGDEFLKGATVKKFLVSVNQGVDGSVEIGKSFDSLDGRLQRFASGLGYGKGQEVNFQIDLKSGSIFSWAGNP
ncbi:MAG: hypothetical protein IPP68_08950 [Elusimicrobia bacterium]|nr:hypothetical protein [Elusimicrobiota bacterium]